MDEIDQASEIEQARVAERLSRLAKEMAARGSPECTECGEDIEEERLQAMPSARRCIKCQVEHEKFARVRRF